MKAAVDAFNATHKGGPQLWGVCTYRGDDLPKLPVRRLQLSTTEIICLTYLRKERFLLRLSYT